MGLQLLSPKTLAEALDVPRTWIYARVRHGEIPHLKMGHYVRFDLDEVLRWLASYRRGATPHNGESNTDEHDTGARPGPARPH